MLEIKSDGHSTMGQRLWLLKDNQHYLFPLHKHTQHTNNLVIQWEEISLLEIKADEHSTMAKKLDAWGLSRPLNNTPQTENKQIIQEYLTWEVHSAGK